MKQSSGEMSREDAKVCPIARAQNDAGKVYHRHPEVPKRSGGLEG